MNADANVASGAASAWKNVGNRLSHLSGPALFWLISLVAQIPLLLLYLMWIWQFEHYHYFPFLLAAVAYLTYSRLESSLQFPASFPALATFVLAVLTLLAGSFLGSPWFGSVSFVLLATSFLLTHRLGYLAVPLVLLVRLPLHYDMQLITALQTITTRLSSYALDLLSVPHLTAGNVIELADRELLVAEACSGVQSAFTIAFVALLLAAWFRRSLVLVPLYLAVSLAWAILANTLRVTTIAYVAARMDVDLSSGLAHDALGYATLLIAILLTLSTDALLGVFFHRVSEAEDMPNPLIYVWHWVLSLGTASFREVPTDGDSEDSEETDVVPAMPGFLANFYQSRRLMIGGLMLVCVMSFVPIAAHAITAPAANQREVFAEGDLLLYPAPDILNNIGDEFEYRFAGAIRDGEDPRLGQNADQWEFEYGPLKGRLVLSQVYTEWHELSLCYTLQDWALRAASLISVRDDGSGKVTFAQFQHKNGTHGYLIYSAINSSGEVVNSPAGDAIRIDDSLFNKALDRCARLVFKPEETAASYEKCAMVQMWVVSPTEIEGDDVRRLALSLAKARDRFAASMREGK